MGYYDDYLEHHGILGQKWGVRRFESASGHLTAAGKNRYNSIDGKYQKVKKVAAALTDPMRNAKGGPVKSNIERENALRRKYGKKTTFENNQEYIKPVEDASRKANSSDTKPTEKKGLTEKQKKMIIAGAAVVGTAVAAYGGYKIYQLNKQATEGLRSDLRATANNKLGEAHRLTKQSGAKLSAYDSEGAYKDLKNATRLREEGGQMLRKANTNNFSISEKVNYLKNQKDSKLGSQTQLEKVKQQYFKDKQKWDRGSQNTPPPLPTSHSKAGVAATNKLASEASSLARSVTSQGPKSFSNPAQNAGQIKSQITTQKYQAATRTINSGSKATSNTIKISGQTKFNQAAKANDDLVQELLKKNTIRF